jgi:hypothetical protein
MLRFILGFPPRQKFMLALTVSAGVFLLFSSLLNIFTSDTANTLIFIYSLGVPLLILGFPTIIDLNNKKIFLVWIVVGSILLFVSIADRNLDRFLIQRSAQFDKSFGINALMASHSTSALKSLFCFLISYWILNEISKQITGNYIVNTFKQVTWDNSDSGRKMTGMDVFCNIILVLVIFVLHFFNAIFLTFVLTKEKKIASK